MKGPYYRVTNWEKYQRYDRNKSAPPPWIKVYLKTVTSPKIASLTDEQFGQLVKLWLLAAQHGNKIPADPSVVRAVTMMRKKPDLQLFVDMGLIKICKQPVDRSSTDCGQVVVPGRVRDRAESETESDTCVSWSEAILYLNEKAGRHFQATGDPAHRRKIEARLRDGYTLEDLKAVVDDRVAEWKGNEKMFKFLRPATLFGKEKFENYHGSLGATVREASMFD